MAEVDELDINPLFRALQTSFTDLYERAQEKCNLICIPQTSSLIGVTINQKFVETHILRPSPYFKGEYHTTHSSKTKTVEFSKNGQNLKTSDGFPQSREIKILSEEQGYNKDYKPYTMLIIERPLDSAFEVNNYDRHQEKDRFTTKITFVECRDFLKSFPECSLYQVQYEIKCCGMIKYHSTLFEIMRHLDESLQLFNKNYMVLKDYLDDAATRLQQLSQDASKKCVSSISHSLWNNVKCKEILRSSIENYAVGSVHLKVFPVICEKYKEVDEKLFSKCVQLNGISADQLGVRSEFSCPLPTSVVELANIDGLKTPLEKLACLKSTMDNMTAEINVNIQENLPERIIGSKEDIPCLTSDDLIPILVTVIAQAKCRHLQANIHYMENFYWSGPSSEKDSLSFCLVTFKAAVHFIENRDASYFLSHHSIKKEISIDELIATTQKTSVDDKAQSASTHDGEDGKTPSRIDKQLERISNILEKSSEDFAQSKKQNEMKSLFEDRPGQHLLMNDTPDVVPLQDRSRKKQQLGDFLTTIEDDVFGTAFGKQT